MSRSRSRVIWENWQQPGTDEWLRTFAVITCPANELMAEIHDRMPVIVPAESYDRWLSTLEPDPHDLLVPFPSEPDEDVADLDASSTRPPTTIPPF